MMLIVCFFFVNDTATTETYTYCPMLSLHAALPIYGLFVGDLSVLEPVGRYQRLFLSLYPAHGRQPDAGDVGRGAGAQLPDRHGVDLLHLHEAVRPGEPARSEEHTSELQSLMRISYAVVCLKKKKTESGNIQPA